MAALVAVATFLRANPHPSNKRIPKLRRHHDLRQRLHLWSNCRRLRRRRWVSNIRRSQRIRRTFAPFTLIIKGAEGLIAGLISNRLGKKRNIIAVVIAGAEMVTGYFLAEFFGLSEGWAALGEVPFNILQIAVGGIIGIPIAIILMQKTPGSLEKPNRKAKRRDSLKARFNRG